MRKLKLFFACLLMAVLSIGQMWATDPVSTLTFTAQAGGKGTADDGVKWTVTSDGTESSYDATKGIHFGTSSAQVTYIQLATSEISGTITKVVVNASTASGVTASASVTVGGSAFGGDAKSLSASATNYTFEGSASGEIIVRVAKPSKAAKAIYVKSVAVTYTSGGGGADPVDPTITFEDGSVDVGYTLDLSTLFTSNSNGDVTYSITSGGTYATIEGSVLTGVAAGSVAVQASQAATASYNAATANSTITVNEHVVTPGKYEVVPNNAFWGRGTQDGSQSVSANSLNISIVSDDVTYNLKNNGSTNSYMKSDHSRAYDKYTLTISVPSGFEMTAITFTGSTWVAPSASVGTMSSKSWTGKANSVTFTFSGTSYMSKISVTYAAIAPEVTVDPASLSFTAKQNIAVDGKTFTLEGANLTSGLALAASTGFTVSLTSLTAEAAMVEGGVEVTVTPATPTTTDAVNGTVTISGGGLSESVEVALSMAVTPTYAVAIAVNDGDMGSATINGGTASIYVTDDEEIALVATPAEHHEFVNWTVSDENIVLNNKNAASTTALAAAAGTITANFQQQACQALAAPTKEENNVATTYQSATIAWNAVSNAEGYVLNVIKHDGGDAVVTDEVIVAPAVSFEIASGLAANTRYDYTVMAIGDGTDYCDANNPVLESYFTTNDYPAATLSLVENGGEAYAWGGENLKMNDVIALPSALAGLGCSGKVLAGWSSVAVAKTDVEPASNYWAAGADYTLGAGAQTLYAVFGTLAGGGASNVAFNAKTYAEANEWANGTAYTEFTIDGVTFTVSGGANDGKYYTSDNTWRFYTGGSLAISGTGITSVSSDPSCTFTESDGTYTCTFTETTKLKSITVSVSTPASYTGYTTSCEAAKPQVATPVISGVTNNETYTTSKTITLTCETEGAAIYYSLDGADAVAYTEAFSVETYGAHTLTAYATKAEYDNSEEASVSFTLNLPFASLEDLVAADLANPTNVTVSFSNVVIKEIYYYNSNRRGLVFDIQKGNEDIKIYYNADVPAEWVAGGKVSGTLTDCPWKIYSGAWQLAPASGFAWATDLSYTAPKAAESVVVSGTPSKTTYVDGEKFVPAGLTVTVNYNDNTSEENPVGVTFACTPERVAKSDDPVSVSVVATFNEIDSDPFEVTGLTVGDIQKKTIEEFIAAGTADMRCYLEGTVSDIETANNKLKYGNFNLTDETGAIYVYGCLNQNGEAEQFASLSVSNGDKIRVIAEDYEYYNKHEAKNVQFVAEAVAITIAGQSVELNKTLDLSQIEVTTVPEGAAENISYSIKQDENKDKVSLDGTTLTGVEIGEATIIASIPDGEGYIANTKEFTVEVVAAIVHGSITYEENGGSEVPDVADATNLPDPLPEPTRDGYTFAGWFTDNNTFNNAVSAGATLTGDITLYAKWIDGSDFAWVAADKGYTNGADVAIATEEADPISIVFAKETAQNGPKYYTSGTAVRTYTGNTITIATKSNTKLINKITFTYSSNNKNIEADGLSEDKLTWTGLAKTVVLTASGQAHFQTITVTYINGTVTTLDITDVSMKLLDGTKNLTIDCNVTPTPAITYEIATEDQAVATIENGVVTAVSVGGPIDVTARIAQGDNYTAAVANFTITVTEKTQPALSFPQAEYNANLGSDFEEPELTNPENVAVAYSSSVEGVATVNAETGVIELVGEGTTVITAAFDGTNDEDYSSNSAFYTLNVIDPNKDVLTAAEIGVSGSYADWSNKTFGSGVKYAGNSTTGTSDNAGAIQMRVSSGTQDKSGIVTTTAKGYLKSISATRKSGTNYLDVYAKGSAYESAADLYDADKRGELIGTINNGTMVFEEDKAYADNYKYIGIKSHSGAVYYDDITITWEPAVFASFDVTYQAGEGTGNDVVESIEEGSIIELAAANTFEAPEGKIFNGWKLGSEENVREAGSKYTVTKAVTFVAQWISVYTITYKPGEASGDDVIVENVKVGDYTLAENTFTAPDNKEFAGWKLDNEDELLAAGSNFVVSGDAEFTAQWSIIKQAAGLAYETASYTIVKGNAFEAQGLTNPYSLPVSYAGNNDEVATVDATTGTVTLQGGIGTVTITATFVEDDYYYAAEVSYTLTVKDANLAGSWVRLTSANDLVDGMKVIIAEYVSTGSDINVMGAQNANNRASVESSLDNQGKLVSNEGTAIFTLVAVAVDTFAFKTADGKYLYAASSGSNYLKLQAEIDGNAKWTISISSGEATITAQGANTRNIMRYNSTNKLFSCYASGQKPIALYSKTVSVSSGEVNASDLEDYADVVVADGATLVIDQSAANKPLGQITGDIEVNAPLTAEGVHLGTTNTMTVNSTVNVPSFSISVQLGGEGQATCVNVDTEHGGEILAPEGYVDMALIDNGRGGAGQWHSFTVPFPVDALNGIYNAETGAKLKNEVNYAIMDYHGDIRATGAYGWKKYRGILQPGTFYMITVDGTCPNLRFMKTQGSNYVAANNIALTYYGDGDNTNHNNGWCGVGNQNMFGGYVNFIVQILNSTGTGYDDVDPYDKKFSACIPFFIQIEGNATLVMSTTNPTTAPARVETDEIKNLRIYFGNENFTDRLTVSASEEALNQYEIGKDLLKMTVSSTPTVPQIFGNAYGDKLCRVNAPIANDQAEVALDLYAPETGEYTISATENAKATVYLTQNGNIIWNLSMSEYTGSFEKGNNAGYGIRIAKAPQVITGIEQSEVSDQPSAQKVIIDEHVYILRGEQLFDVNGKMVK